MKIVQLIAAIFFLTDERSHQNSNYSRPQTSTSRSGELDVAGITKFGRKEAKALRVIVSFNGEQHEFAVEAPPAK